MLYCLFVFPHLTEWQATVRGDFRFWKATCSLTFVHYFSNFSGWGFVMIFFGMLISSINKEENSIVYWWAAGHRIDQNESEFYAPSQMEYKELPVALIYSEFWIWSDHYRLNIFSHVLIVAQISNKNVSAPIDTHTQPRSVPLKPMLPHLTTVLHRSV